MALNRTEPEFSVRLVCAEFYQTSPIPGLDPVYSDFRGAEIKHVPVIRIFGSTLAGEKTCLHVHGVFPYMYVPYTGGEDSDRLGYRLAASLDAAINVSLGSAAARNQHVFKVQLISGMPFYGYHEREHQYFKIYFYNPGMVKRAANLLQNGAVLNKSLQPHEAHIPYVQQFMIDYNLHGMSMVELRHVKHRWPSDVHTHSPFANGWDYLSSEIIRQSTCMLEADALASDILNRREIEGELVLNPGLASIWEEERARRLQLGQAGGDSQLVQSRSPTRPVFEPTENDIYQRQRLTHRLSTVSQNEESMSSAEARRSQSSYPLETDDNSNLINASCLEHHVGQPDLRSTSLVSPAQTPSQFLDCSVLDAADASLLDILNELADENTVASTVDDDSPLGSQCVDSEVQSCSHGVEDEKEDENDDMNLTLLQLDSLSWSQCKESSQTSMDLQVTPSEAVKETAYDYFRDLSVFDLDTDENSDDGSISENIVPQCDGAGDPLSPNTEKINNEEKEFSAPNDFTSETTSLPDSCCGPALRTMNASYEPPSPPLDPECHVEFHSKDSTAANSSDKKNMNNPGDSPLISTNPTTQLSTDGTRTVRINDILALDGPADLSSEDSDLETDITLERQEKRICGYRSTAPANQEKVINVAGNGRKRNCQEAVDVMSRSPEKCRKSSFVSTRTSVSHSPKRSMSLNGSRSHPSRSYSPLTIIFKSPGQIRENRNTNLPPIIDEGTSRERVKRTLSHELTPITNLSVNNGNNDRSTDETDEEGTCDVTFTQYLDTQLKLNANSVSRCESFGNGKTGSGKEIVIVPRFNPSSSDKVSETLETYGIPVFRNENPFFGNHTDATYRKEVAHKFLKVPSKSLVDLPLFKSDLNANTGIRLWRAMKVKEVYPSGAGIERSKLRQRLTGKSKIAIIPLAAAPSPKTVKVWSRAKDRLKKLEAVGNPTGGKSIVNPQQYEKLQKSTKHDRSQGGTSGASSENDSQPSCTTNLTGMDASLENALQNSNLYNNIELSRQLGISCGQIEGSSQADQFKIPCENLQDIKPLATHQYITILCLELHIHTRGDLLPDPQHDAIGAIFYAIDNDTPDTSNLSSIDFGVLVCDPTFDVTKSSGHLKGSGSTCPVSYATSEGDLFENLLSLIGKNDPDILVGWELETLSWGYLFQRAANIGINLAPRVSRIPSIQRAWETQTTELNILTEIKMPGRIVLDVWRIMRHEVALQSYTFENIMYHVMHQRLNCPSFAMLTRWWEHRAPREHSMVVEHYTAKVVGILKLIHQLDIIGKTTEFARLYGIQFFEVFSRGSQFQVESVMLRLAKPSNYVPVSPSTQQRATMRAPESLPLIMEPESVFYSDPLIVLDFQSLYPSIIIAHNYCFSTCLGRVENIGQSVPFEFGATSLRVTRRTALKLEDGLNFSPCGVAFVRPEVRMGILPRMLTEYLDTRLMVKKAMKDHSQAGDTLQRALHSRQRGLKLLANVTFGYTHANFSGRMPCIEIGDSIVSKARETLERAIKLVESTKRWNARVVYGDTDSLFVLLPGRSRSQAFEVGAEIASAVTAANPKPMKLKLEKIMQPAILQTKKRYCGYMYESPDQEKPIYLAKGIETVRRDGCPAVSKILEKTLRILFDTRDVSQVKRYVIRQLDKVLRGRVSIQDLTFAKEFRGLQGYKSSACVPALELTRRLITKDPRAIPRTSERVPYVIVAGAPNQPLFQCVRSPWELIADTGLRPNALYYTTRVIIPPLNRCLNLLGVDANAWFDEMPHRQAINCNPGGTIGGEPQKSTISQYFGTVACASCSRTSNAGICTECSRLPNQTIVILHEKIRQIERSQCSIVAICQSCVKRATGSIECASLDCPVLYRRVRCINDQRQISYIRQIIDKGDSLER